MNDESARLLIKSFVGRLVLSGDSFQVPERVLSKEEVDAMRHFAGAPIQTIPLNLLAQAQKGPAEKDLRLCLDFGTAMSKAWATGRTDRDTMPLVLGRSTGDGEVLVLPSSIYVGEDDRIYFGTAADRMFRQENKPGRKKFENLKRMLSEIEVNSDLYSVPVRAGIDPTNSGLRQGDFLVLYLAWLTDHALKTLCELIAQTNLSELNNASLRFVRRRFAIPCFENADDEKLAGGERARWALHTMRDAILRAQVVADTLSGQWINLTMKKAVEVISQVRAIAPDSLSHLLASTPSVREPIAAGASRFSESLDEINQSGSNKRVRRFLMVIDAGAGTTDFAVFQVIDHGDANEPEYVLIKPSVRMCRIAGNAFDELLRPIVLKSCDIDPSTGNPRSPDDFSYIKMDLEAEIKNIKHQLFNDKEVKINLKPNAQGVLSEAMLSQDSMYKKHHDNLKAIRHSSLASIFGSTIPEEYREISLRYGQAIPVHVMLTGGSAAVPIIRDLASGETSVDGVQFAFKLIDRQPDWIKNLPRETAALVASVYPQAAVAVGGSTPTLPAELDDIGHSIDPAPAGERKLGRYQVTGV